MNYKGAYDSSASYSVGDVVVYTDGLVYFMKEPAAAGTTPHDTHHWNRLLGYLADAVTMFHSMLSGLQATKSIADAMLFDEKTILLASSTASSDKVYAVTVDDEDGLVATEVIDSDEEAGDA